MICECGNTRFYANQICRHTIIIDEKGNYIDEAEIADAEKPQGPFQCTKCTKTYEDFD
jgi:hypothetical protein